MSGMTDSNVASAVFDINPPVIPSVFWVPGRIEAEDYRIGGEDVGYHDTTTGNQFGEYRDDDVDIGDTIDVGGGYSTGAIASGEWLLIVSMQPTAFRETLAPLNTVETKVPIIICSD